MAFQSCGSFNFGNFGSPGQNDIWVLVSWLGTKYTIRGRWWFPPSPGRGESCESVFVRGSSVPPKVFKLRTNQLVVWFVHVRVKNRLLDIFPSPHPRAPMRPSTPKVLQARECAPTPYSSVVFTLNSHLNLSRSLGARHIGHCLDHILCLL
jgi:hypothetical protein